jgi:hypothetical protein
VNKEQFEEMFKSGSAAGADWAKEHGKVTLGIICFLLGWSVGKIF